jgi:hypothetical protein
VLEHRAVAYFVGQFISLPPVRVFCRGLHPHPPSTKR